MAFPTYQSYEFLIIASILSVLGLFILLAFKKSHKLKELFETYVKESGGYDLLEKPYPDVKEVRDFEKMVNNVNNNYRILAAVYGIMLGFVVSEKIIFVLSSWYFVLWCGMILGIIVRLGNISLTLSELVETTSEHDKIKRKINSANKFFKAALFLLIPTIALLPGFFMLGEAPTYTNVDFPHFALYVGLSGAVIFSSFIYFYSLAFNMSDLENKKGDRVLYYITFMGIVLGTLVYAISPITPIPIFLDGIKYEIPLILILLPLFGSLYAFVMSFRLVCALSMKLPEKYRPMLVKWLGRLLPF